MKEGPVPVPLTAPARIMMMTYYPFDGYRIRGI